MFFKRIIKCLLRKAGFILIRDKYEDNRPLKADLFPGFFSEKESRSLYALTVLTQGAILEIGHFLGESTACICESLYDSKQNRTFTSYYKQKFR